MLCWIWVLPAIFYFPKLSLAKKISFKTDTLVDDVIDMHTYYLLVLMENQA